MAKLNTESAQAKTAGDMRNHNTRMQLLTYVERFERLQEEKDSLGEDQKEVMSEAKALGFDTAILRKVIQRRKKDASDLSEADALLELYEDVIAAAMKQQVKDSEAEAAPPKQMDIEEVAPVVERLHPDEAAMTASDALEPPAFLRRAR